jgi:hypothetical protein
MSTKTKWLAAGAVAVLVIAGVLIARRGEEASSSSSRGESAAEALDASVAQAPGASAPVAGAHHRDVSGLPPPPPGFVAGIDAPPPHNSMPYRPAKLLIYSEFDVSQDPAGDEKQEPLRRIIEVTGADSAQAQQIRDLWKIHEDGRRRLWDEAIDRKSGPRLLNPPKLAALDNAFESELLSKVLQPDQGQRLLDEVGPKSNGIMPMRPPPPPP